MSCGASGADGVCALCAEAAAEIRNCASGAAGNSSDHALSTVGIGAGGVKRDILIFALNDPVLAGIRVLDLSSIVAGPAAGMILADLGAQVLKVERPGSGDDARAMGPHPRQITSLSGGVNL
jgi:hypothetical protein